MNNLSHVILTACYQPLGMEDRSITDSQITASSFKTDRNKSFKPAYGRLHNRPSGAMGGAWCAGTSDKSQYLQIDLKKEMTLSGVATQGQLDETNWVEKYSIQHSKDGTNWKDYKEFGYKEVCFAFLNFNCKHVICSRKRLLELCTSRLSHLEQLA